MRHSLLLQSKLRERCNAELAVIRMNMAEPTIVICKERCRFKTELLPASGTDESDIDNVRRIQRHSWNLQAGAIQDSWCIFDNMPVTKLTGSDPIERHADKHGRATLRAQVTRHE